ncbi:MAG: serine/threonine-protein kinase, partial [Planctomycetota bacterium]
MFCQEAAIGLELSHPNLVEVTDYGRFDEHHFIEMEYWQGRTLRQLLHKSTVHNRPVSVSVALAAMIDCCYALAYVHSFQDGRGRAERLVHRDVSPENLIMGDFGVTKLLDFGIASSPALNVTEADERKGKLHYMPPEAFTAQPVDKRRDLYAVGAILYELLTGQQPFRGENDVELMQSICHEDLPPPSARRSEIHAELDNIILKAMARKAEDRWSTAGELAAVLADHLWRHDQRGRHQVAAEAIRQLANLGDTPDSSGAFSIDVVVDAPLEKTPATQEVVVSFPSTASRRARRRRQANDPGEPPAPETSEVTADAEQIALAYFDEGLRHHREGDLQGALDAWTRA